MNEAEKRMQQLQKWMVETEKMNEGRHLLKQVLTDERRATVEKIRTAIEAGRISEHGTVITPDIDAILDEEAAR